MKHLILALALLASTGAAAADPAARTGKPAVLGDLVYACNMGDRDAMFLNLTRHQFHFVDHEGVLNEGLSFNFRTKAGYLVQMDLGDPDRLHFNKPRRVRGWGTVGGPGGSQGKLESILCVRTR
jgi:hypothetical protein